MKIFDKEHIVAFDVDQTLVMHDNKGPHTVISSGLEYSFRIHEKHEQLLLQYKARGYVVVVWSSAGYQWAADVVKFLKLEDQVDMVMTKPEKHVDDLPSGKILGSRIYIPED